jgi:hypothetical protein
MTRQANISCPQPSIKAAFVGGLPFIEIVFVSILFRRMKPLVAEEACA